MEYRIKVIASSKDEGVTLLRDSRYEVPVNAPRKEGRANERATLLFAQHLKVSTERVSLVRGHAHSTKVLFVRP